LTMAFRGNFANQEPSGIDWPPSLLPLYVLFALARGDGIW